ncbi:hypothetical protein G4V62_02270 [Bacillaceae bacterium SIJ1]|uniref:hypothetical protein n=1 Tax=Litoribacterium kuwaitense TaxID=1398745 RepID=UPI0013EA1AF9|nr:hypothetical protein [Litoribacterium kuwaitense]NGP43831.1 hypothetical protein [Litoribacterium kuwaitense]
MSPTLSRKKYFLTVMNELHCHKVEHGSIEQELQFLLLALAGAVRDKQPLEDDLVRRINIVFAQYQAIRLKVSMPNENVSKDSRPTLLHAEFVDGAESLKRMYMEAIISLLEAMEGSSLQLQMCTQCQHWFIPYQRAQVTKFCSAKCRNRYHYLQRKLG